MNFHSAREIFSLYPKNGENGKISSKFDSSLLRNLKLFHLSDIL
jgi:hypothetical protein